ncbi:uncharacterized protein [Palaemon carinicauda]|uniref:uncharacterized protein n=1 Tax=Palaemon carinicauda TaxID=392227 RepID=UPI0035B60D30
MEVREFVKGIIILIIFTSVVNGYGKRTLLPTVERTSSIGLDRDSQKPSSSPCVDTIACGSETFVAKCTNCDPRYFYCKGPGVTPMEERCSPGQLFNPDPLYPRCVPQGNCPYLPLRTVKAPATDPECVDTVICKDELFVAKCKVCDPRYFYCKEPGATPVEKRCASGKMFNPVPLFGSCILQDNCPYYPPWTLPTTKPTTTTTTTTTTLPTTTTTTSTTTSTSTTTTTTSTTTPSTTPTTKSTTTPFSGCYDSLLCEGIGDYARCNYCQETYFHCEKEGLPGMFSLCKDDKVFNIDPAFPACVPSSDCPYHPSTPVSSTLTSNIPTTSSDCRDSFLCPSGGNFTKCNYCYKEYFHCGAKGEKGIINNCDGKWVFNTDPKYTKCISPFNCPYPPTN